MVLVHPGAVPRAEPRYLLLKHRGGGHWSFPKGHVEPGESDWQAAARELVEETGITAFTRLEGFAHELRYRVRRGRAWADKTVIFFLATTPQTRVRLSAEHVDAAWLVYPQARERLTFPNSRELLDRAQAYLSAHFPPEARV